MHALTLAGHDAAGAPLVSGAKRTYRIDEPIRSRVDPRLWVVHWPDADGDQLVVRFGRSLDRFLVSCLKVVGLDGRVVPGQAVLDRDAAIWTFTSAIASVTGWGLHVHPDLEDLAGNSVRRPFDRDLWDLDAGRLSSSPVVLTTDQWRYDGSPVDISDVEVLVLGRSPSKLRRGMRL